MGVAALNAVHPPRIFTLAAVEKARRGMTAPFQVRDFQGIQVHILRVGNLGLAAKGKIAHRNPMRAIGMGCNSNPAGLVNNFIGR